MVLGAILIPIIFFGLRVYAILYSVKKAEQKNRKPAGFAIGAIFFPIITMIVVSNITNGTTWHTNN